MTRFLGGPGTSSDKEGLIQWANGRFHTSLSPADLKEKERPEIESDPGQACAGARLVVTGKQPTPLCSAPGG